MAEAHLFRACGYATDPVYANPLISVARKYGLTKYNDAPAQLITQAATARPFTPATKWAQGPLPPMLRWFITVAAWVELSYLIYRFIAPQAVVVHGVSSLIVLLIWAGARKGSTVKRNAQLLFLASGHGAHSHWPGPTAAGHPTHPARRPALALHYVLVASYYLPLALVPAAFFDLVLNAASDKPFFYVGQTAGAERALQWLAARMGWTAEGGRLVSQLLALGLAVAYLLLAYR